MRICKEKSSKGDNVLIIEVKKMDSVGKVGGGPGTPTVTGKVGGGPGTPTRN
jgi:hypothetical protein